MASATRQNFSISAVFYYPSGLRRKIGVNSMLKLLYNRRGFSVGILTFSSLLTPGAYAASALDAHEHGHATLDIATENQTVELYFKSPAVNLIGFEHAPENNDERDQLKNAVAWFDQHSIIDIVNRNCELSRSSIEETVTQEAESHNDHHHEHGEHEGSHSEFIVNQTLSCDTNVTGEISTAGLLKQFNGIEELDVSWVTSSGQGGGEVTRESMTLNLGD
ncbi:ZrgA family zinc uptake protein [Marinobacter sp. V034]|uniref:ZrgA family zinc uptake protein n=1 Tax=Marinobacter sp. V034 TaxID=3459610 RepID=UPI004043F71D